MKVTMIFRLLPLLLVVTTTTPAPAALYSYTNTVNQTIADNSASPLLNTITVSGVLDWNITDVNVRLNVSGGWNGDLYAYLLHNNTTRVVLLNRIGLNGAGQDGFGDAGFSILLDDSAASDIHLTGTGGSPLTGDWQPDGRDVDPDAVLNSSARTALLNQYNGQDPNGTWTLAFADVSGGFQSTLNSWSLDIVAVVPEPTGWALLIFGILAGLIKLLHWQRPRLRASPGPL
jgi:subtilisin-like proprotein convertase family protein